MQHKGTEKLQTERLILRRFTIRDAAAMFRNWANDDQVTKYLMWPSHKSPEVSREVLEDWIFHYGEKDFYQWAITVKENGEEPIGSISVVSKDDSIEMVHIGYCIGKRWWHQGVTSEALKEVIRFFMEEVKVNRVEPRHDPRNVNSGKVMKKCGMVYEGTRRQADRNNQGICDASGYAILAEDYFGVSAQRNF